MVYRPMGIGRWIGRPLPPSILTFIQMKAINVLLEALSFFFSLLASYVLEKTYEDLIKGFRIHHNLINHPHSELSFIHKWWSYWRIAHHLQVLCWRWKPFLCLHWFSVYQESSITMQRSMVTIQSRTFLKMTKKDTKNTTKHQYKPFKNYLTKLVRISEFNCLLFTSDGVIEG